MHTIECHLATKTQLISTQWLHKGKIFLVHPFFSICPIPTPIPDSRYPIPVNRYVALFTPQKKTLEVGGALLFACFVQA